MVDVFINNEKVDLQGVTFNITYQLQDFITKESVVSHSNTLNLPLTKNNLRIYNNRNELNSEVDSSDAGRIEVDGTVKLEGFAYLISIKDTIKVQIVEEAVEWIKDFKTNNLRDVDLFPMYALSGNQVSNWVDAYPYNAVGWNHFYGIDNKGWDKNFLALDKFNHPYVISDRTPNVNILKLLNKMFVQYYTIESSLMRSSDFTKLFIPYTGKFKKDTVDTATELEGLDDSYAGLIYGLSTVTVSHTFTDIIEEFIAEESWSYVFTINMNYELDTYNNFTNDVSIYIDIYKNGSLLKTLQQTYTGNIAIINVVYELEVGDVITIELRFTDTVTNPDQTAQTFRATVTNPSSSIKFGHLWGTEKRITPDVVLPDIKQIDFFNGLKKAFNLIVHADKNTRKIHIDPFNVFYDSFTNIVDWTELQDESKIAIIENMSSKVGNTFEYGFSEDEDKGFKEVNYTNKVAIDNSTNRADTKRVSDICCTEIGEDVAYLDGVIPKHKIIDVPKITKDSEDINIVKYLGAMSGFDWVEGETAQTTYPACEAFDVDDTEQYFADYIDILNNGKKITAYFNISDRELSNLHEITSPEFIACKRKVKINGDTAICIINKIVENPVVGGAVKVELIKLP